MSKEAEHTRAGQFQEGEERQVSRRQFVSAVGLATAGVITAACSKNSNPVAFNSQSSTQQPSMPPSGTVGGSSNQAAVQVATNNISTYDYATLRANIESAVDKIGGLADICKAGDTVGVKLNMTGGSASADKCPRNYGLNATELFWTHPTILRVCLELFKDAGAGRLIVMEAIYDQKSYAGYGYADVVNAVGAEFINLNRKAPHTDFVKVEVPNPLGRWPHYYHNGALHELDCFVSLPKAKRHYGAGVTHSLKNMVGSIPLSIYTKYNDGKEGSEGGSRQAMHERGMPTLVRNFLDICRIRPIHFAINDAIQTADNGEGTWNEGFKPARYDKLIIGKDPVAVDSISTQVIGWDPMVGDFEGCFAADSLPGNFSGTDNYLRIAQEAGMGIYDVSQIQVVDASINTRVVVHG
ncbi:DUF362 domain-containing protein [candidate division KSB1 bacterium]|nr:DUF362 domain-containing protein [candidate division KSB1 bacterium]